MDHDHHSHYGKEYNSVSPKRMAASATLHCLIGCAIGETLGLVIGNVLGWSNFSTIALAVALAFVSGYAMSTLPLMKTGMKFFSALSIVFAADTLSILTMEIVDNGVMLAIPGAMHAGVDNPLFWGSMTIAFAVAYVVAFPVNLYLLSRGKGHALLMQHHSDHH